MRFLFPIGVGLVRRELPRRPMVEKVSNLLASLRGRPGGVRLSRGVGQAAVAHWLRRTGEVPHLAALKGGGAK
jgi:hypothetical protein